MQPGSTTAPNSRDCGTGCVHLCATQCALANANGSPGPSSSGGTGGGTAAAYAALALGQVNGEAAGVGHAEGVQRPCRLGCHVLDSAPDPKMQHGASS